jgi:cell wall-associated NlpC family hydrolase
MLRATRQLWLAALAAGLLAGCSTTPTGERGAVRDKAAERASSEHSDMLRREVVFSALSLIDTGYKFGGSNPEAGLDCSGLVVLVYKMAAGMSLPHNAAQIARNAQEVSLRELKAGDLIFFNTLGRPFSHVGIYLGDDKFIHAPNSRGRVRVESIRTGYFARRIDGARTLLED